VAERTPVPIRPAGDEPIEPVGSPLHVSRRAVAVVLAVAVVAASGWWLDRAGVRAAGLVAAREPATGAWFCPHGGGKDWQGWLVVTNPGTSPARVRATSFNARGATRVDSFDVGPAQQVYRPLASSAPEASTEVEYFGGWVAAATVALAPDSRLADERCVGAEQPMWIMPDAMTGSGETSFLIVMNPFDTSAEFDVTFRTERRVVRPGSLTPQVLKPGRSTIIRVNSFALSGPTDRTVTAQVTPIIGRVVVGSVGMENGTLRAEAGLPGFSDRWVLPASGFSGTGRLTVVNPSNRDAHLSVVAEGPDGVQTVSAPSTQIVHASTAATISTPDFPGAGDVVRSVGQVPVAAALRLDGGDGDQATIAGAEAPASSWVILSGVPEEGGDQLLVLQNPGTRAAEVEVRLIGGSGALTSGPGTVVVPGGRTITIDLSDFVGTTPVSALVTASEGTIVAAGASYSLDRRGYGLTLGVPAQ
jgi:hypothetical protein